MASERKIGGVVYRCDPMSAEEGIDMLLRVTEFFRQAPKLMSSIAVGDSSQNALTAFMTLILGARLDREETKQLLSDLVQQCRAGSDPCVIGVKPEGMKDVLAVAWFVMEVNFRGFLEESLAGIELDPEAENNPGPS